MLDMYRRRQNSHNYQLIIGDMSDDSESEVEVVVAVDDVVVMAGDDVEVEGDDSQAGSEITDAQSDHSTAFP